jgi:hypothetical protein
MDVGRAMIPVLDFDEQAQESADFRHDSSILEITCPASSNPKA